jgi:hypothetical protein
MLTIKNYRYPSQGTSKSQENSRKKRNVRRKKYLSLKRSIRNKKRNKNRLLNIRKLSSTQHYTKKILNPRWKSSKSLEHKGEYGNWRNKKENREKI